MKTGQLITRIPNNDKAKEDLFELLENNDDLMLEVLDKIFATLELYIFICVSYLN